MMRLRVWLAVVLLGLVAVAGAPVAPAATAQPADDTKLNVVKAGYDILLDYFYRPLAPAGLLRDGWDHLNEISRSAGFPAVPALGELPADRSGAFESFSQVYRSYVGRLPRDRPALDVAFAVVDGMASSLSEGHTAFYTPEQYRASISSSGGSRLPVGFGFTPAPRPPYVVTSVVPDGPAAQGGLVPGDVIVAIDGMDVSSVSRSTFNAALAGPEGAVKVLTVDRGGVGDRRDLTMTRGLYYNPPLDSRLLPGNVGYLRLSRFVQIGAPLPDGRQLLPELDRRLDELDAQGATGLVLDLRDNPGGYTNTAAELIGRFLPEDEVTVLRFDERGHSATGIASGMMRRRQLPLVVLVNGGSYSSSEVTASTLKEAGRATLVGERTGGSLATAQLLALPEGAGLQVAMAEQLTARRRFKIDDAGFPVDIQVRDTRTAADYLAGRDPQLQAAVAALPAAPAPPAFRSSPTGVSEMQLREALSRYTPDPALIPTNERLTRVERTQSLQLTHPNQYAGISSHDPLALQQALRRRGWLGEHTQSYSVELLGQPYVGVTIDLYATPEGAAEHLATNDFPEVVDRIPAPIQLGEATVAYNGKWLNIGDVQLQWRRGSVVFTVDYADVPGLERMDTVIAVARLVDALFSAHPLPSTYPTKDVGAVE
jgi:carboxyl-terminal processing protease